MPAGSTKYQISWEKNAECKGWLSPLKLPDGTASITRAKCSWCDSDFSITSGEWKDIKSHFNSKKHEKFAAAKIGTKSVVDFIGIFLYLACFA